MRCCGCVWQEAPRKTLVAMNPRDGSCVVTGLEPIDTRAEDSLDIEDKVHLVRTRLSISTNVQQRLHFVRAASTTLTPKTFVVAVQHARRHRSVTKVP